MVDVKKEWRVDSSFEKKHTLIEIIIHPQVMVYILRDAIGKEEYIMAKEKENFMAFFYLVENGIKWQNIVVRQVGRRKQWQVRKDKLRIEATM